MNSRENTNPPFEDNSRFAGSEFCETSFVGSMINKYAYIPIAAVAALASLSHALHVGGRAWLVFFVWGIAAVYFLWWCRNIYHVEFVGGVLQISDLRTTISVPASSLSSVERGVGRPPCLVLVFSPATSFGAKIRVFPKSGIFGMRLQAVNDFRDCLLAASKAARKQSR